MNTLTKILSLTLTGFALMVGLALADGIAHASMLDGYKPDYTQEEYC